MVRSCTVPHAQHLDREGEMFLLGKSMGALQDHFSYKVSLPADL